MTYHSAIAPNSVDIRTWLDMNWSVDLTVREWWARLHRSGLAFPTWPRPWGLDWRHEDLELRDRIFIERSILAPPIGLGTMMGGPIVIDFGSNEQKERWLPELAAGTELWCQMFSEPDAGSDLASIQTTATRDGDEWVINGQKVWTSLAPEAQRAMLVARSDWDAPKHRGLTFFILDMNTPGIMCRPLRQMNGQAHFNEVFLSNVRIPDFDRLGNVHEGWSIALATLAHERRNVPGIRTDVPRPTPGMIAGNLARQIVSLVPKNSSGSNSMEEAGTALGLAKVARSQGRNGDLLVRQRLAQQYIFDSVRSMTRDRLRDEAKQAGKNTPGPKSSIIKLARTQGMRHAQTLAFELLGAKGTLSAEEVPEYHELIDFCLTVPSKSIAGGTDEIQRNLVAERALGLPKEVGIDTRSPFRDIPRSPKTTS